MTYTYELVVQFQFTKPREMNFYFRNFFHSFELRLKFRGNTIKEKTKTEDVKMQAENEPVLVDDAT